MILINKYRLVGFVAGKPIILLFSNVLNIPRNRKEKSEVIDMSVIEFRNIREGNYLGIVMVFPTGAERLVAWMEVPYRGDFRADVEAYDEFLKLYKKRLKKAFPKQL